MAAFSPAVCHTATATTVGELLDSFHLAAACADIGRYFGAFYSAESRFIGTDAAENWTVAEFYAYSKPHFDAGKAWTYTPRPASRKVTELKCGGGGGDASVSRIATFDELLDSEAFVATTRGTGTAVFDGKYWFLLAFHLSFPTPNDIAEQVLNKIVVHEKKVAAMSAAAKADEAAAALLAELELEETGTKQLQNQSKKKKGR